MVMMEAYSRPTYDIVFQWIWFQLKIFPISDLGPSLRRRSVKDAIKLLPPDALCAFKIPQRMYNVHTQSPKIRIEDESKSFFFYVFNEIVVYVSWNHPTLKC